MKNLNEITFNQKKSEHMPVLFIGHGSPMNAIEENEFVTVWREIGKTIPKPAAILCISAHWETRGTFVTAMRNPSTIHDFSGFPPRLYQVQYPAPGSPNLANEIKGIIRKYQIGLDEKWGLDHGCWSILRQLFPDADIPVIQLSLDYYQNPQYHYNLGKELAPLRKKGVLIIGSGNIVHNLRLAAWNRLNDLDYGYDWALEANEKIKSFILSNNHQALINYQTQGKAFEMAIPTPEHFLPLLYTLALKEENEKVSLFNDRLVAGSLSMTSIKINNI